MSREQSITVGGVSVRVEEFCLDTDADISLCAARLALSTNETERAQRFVYDLHRDRFVRGRGYLRRRLSGHLGCAPADVPLVQGSRGKPELATGSVAFNLSNSADRAVLALTWVGMVGIDLELLSRTDSLRRDVTRLAKSCMTPAEQGILADLPDYARPRRFLEFWTAKEARMKLTGDGMHLDPRDISLTLQDGSPVGIETPRIPPCALEYVDLGRLGAICCLATSTATTCDVPIVREKSDAWTC